MQLMLSFVLQQFAKFPNFHADAFKQQIHICMI